MGITAGETIINRRRFLKSAIGMGVAAGTSAANISSVKERLPQKSREAVLKLSSLEHLVKGTSLRDKVVKLERWGANGIELLGKGLPGRVKGVEEALKGTNIKVSAVCAGYKGALISHQPAERKKAVRTIKEILTAAGQVGAGGMIIVPAFNKQTKLDNKEGRKVLVDLLPQLGEHACKCGTRVLMEPLNRREAFFLRLLADAAAICRDVNHPCVAMMGDFYHMTVEETSDMGAFISAGKYLHHVHIASRIRRYYPGQDGKSFVDGFRGLKMIGYNGCVSLECTSTVKGDSDVEIPKSFGYLQKQWQQVCK
ncbi:MAG: sugar phosphate isomerase/epimerase [Sedimentisphaerales bacterium]|nr:sugar phosphate isomerase/epimerase [Sedimentisphaerales bacterium]